MDNCTPSVEALRAQLRSLPRKRVLAIADAAQIARSTVQKFRLGHITEPGAFKIERLAQAVATASEAATSTPEKA